MAANARILGSGQTDALQNIVGSIGLNMNDAAPTGAFYRSTGSSGSQTGAPGLQSVLFDASRVARTAIETRPTNTAFVPVINL